MLTAVQVIIEKFVGFIKRFYRVGKVSEELQYFRNCIMLRSGALS